MNEVVEWGGRAVGETGRDWKRDREIEREEERKEN